MNCNKNQAKKDLFYLIKNYVTNTCYCDFNIFLENCDNTQINVFINDLIENKNIMGKNFDYITKKYIKNFVNQYI